jgi:hypothetical protein
MAAKLPPMLLLLSHARTHTQEDQHWGQLSSMRSTLSTIHNTLINSLNETCNDKRSTRNSLNHTCRTGPRQHVETQAATGWQTSMAIVEGDEHGNVVRVQGRTFEDGSA